MPVVDGVTSPDPETYCPICGGSLEKPSPQAIPQGADFECFDCVKGWTLDSIAAYVAANP